MIDKIIFINIISQILKFIYDKGYTVENINTLNEEKIQIMLNKIKKGKKLVLDKKEPKKRIKNKNGKDKKKIMKALGIPEEFFR